MKRAIFKFTLEFKEGIIAGHGSQGNRMLVELNGKGEPVLRGSSFAGCLRSAYQKMFAVNNNDVLYGVFGTGAENENDNKKGDSALKIADTVLETGKAIINERICHLRDRHHGRPLDKGLFSIQFCPPGTKAPMELIYEYDDGSEYNRPEALELFQRIHQILSNGLFLGGNSNRGVGLASIKSDFEYYLFDDTLEAYGSYLDCRYDKNIHLPWQKMSTATSASKSVLKVKLSWKIAEGEDLLVASGGSADSSLEPMLMKHADGNDYYAIPGSSFRGVFRNWFNHLAAREGKEISDSVENFIEDTQGDYSKMFSGDEVSNLFEKSGSKEGKEKHENDPVARLFGSLHKVGRIHISSAFQKANDQEKERLKTELQDRAHVAIDYITGGSIEHMLFNTIVLVNNKDPFINEIIIQNPTEDEISWLNKTLDAFNLGLLRLGSSKASGRMQVSLIEKHGALSDKVQLKNLENLF